MENGAFMPFIIFLEGKKL